MKVKVLCSLVLLTLIASPASAQSITRCGGPTNALYINWPDFHFDQCHTGYNPYEHTLSTSSVGSLSLAWQHGISGNPVTSSPVLVNGIVYVVSFEGTLYALNANTGTPVWQKAINASPGVAVANGVLYVSSLARNDGNYIYALDAATGAVIWQDTTPSSGGPPTVADGIVHVHVYTSLYALDAHSGAVIWQEPVSPGNGPPTVVNGIVYTGTGAGTVLALNARTGATIWSVTTTGSINSSLAVINGVVYVGGDNSQHRSVVVYALNALTGAVTWNSELMDLDTFSELSPAVANGTVYVSGDSTLWALDAATGALNWSLSRAYGYGQSAPAVANGVVYLGSGGTNFVRAIYAVNAANGNVLWEYGNIQSMYFNRSSPAVANGTVFIGTADGYLLAFHLPN